MTDDGAPTASPRALLLAIDTAGTQALVALGELDGEPVAESRWTAGYRHGEELLARLDALLASHGLALGDLAGIVAGTGPGAFTGLRVGIATAKALARGLEVPIVGVATAEALLAAARAEERLPAAAELALLLPAGPSDRVLVERGAASLLRGGEDPVLAAGVTLVAVDLPARAPAGASALGERARAGLGSALLRLGSARLVENPAGDDVSRLVPEYVTLPRGVRSMTGEVRWSLDRS